MHTVTESIDRLDLVSTAPAEQLLLGRIEGWQLPRPWWDVFLLGRLTLQRELEDAQAELRRLDTIDAQPPTFDVRALEQISFAELSRRRGESARAERADKISRLVGALYERGVA